MTIDWKQIQDKWQKKWEEAKIGDVTDNKKKDKFMMIFAYPGLTGFPHVGHMRGFSYTDMVCRYERLLGKTVLFPVGTHASGNHAFAFAKKIKNKDAKWIDYLIRNGCDEKKVQELVTPDKIISYFNEVYVNDYFKKFGFICDWDRFTSTTYPDYEKFIAWQFQKLNQKNLLVQKPYFATACVNCGPVAVDPSETDISKGGNAEKNEYTLLKFKLDSGAFLVAATLRPETVFGQTNLWINPDKSYVNVSVEGEEWIMSRSCADKLKYQKDDVILKEDVDVKNLIGKMALAPGVEREIIILPARFVDVNIGSGIVTSVPAHAPHDYMALKDLEKDPETLKEFGLTSEQISKIDLISIIDVKGYQEFPAKQVCEKLQIKDQFDLRLEEAKKEVYKAEFHSGILKKNCKDYSDMKVEQAKELMKVKLLADKKADVLHDLSEEVICRCGGKVIIKRIDDQWFIKYSDSELTLKSKEHAKEMTIYPKDYSQNMDKVLDWFHDRACVRQGNWMGSKFVLDDKWTVEPISDSTLYPSYYIVSKHVNNGTLKVEDLTEEFFDYVFLGIGESSDSRWQKVRSEFEYFYPLDINLGGKEHQTVHFPVFLMNHVAILKQEHWPKGIFVNYWVTGKGSKISKSKGGAEPIPGAMVKYGVDSMRFYYAHIGSPHTDIVWDESVVFNYKNTLEKIYLMIEELRELGGRKKLIDDWLVSRLNMHIKKIKQVMVHYSLRELSSIVYYTIYDDFKWYLRRGGEHKATIDKVIRAWIVLMNPITPHLSEELNDSEELVSAALWPEYSEELISNKSDAGEELIRGTLEGVRNVLKLAKVEKPTKISLFVSQAWQYELFELLSKEIKVTRNIGEIMKRVLDSESLKTKGKEVSKIVVMILKDPSKLPQIVTSQKEELATLEDAKNFIQDEFNCSVEIINSDESSHAKARSAYPGKVGLNVE
jgi:leucyl-tRNA synthetase